MPFIDNSMLIYIKVKVRTPRISIIPRILPKTYDIHEFYSRTLFDLHVLNYLIITTIYNILVQDILLLSHKSFAAQAKKIH